MVTGRKVLKCSRRKNRKENSSLPWEAVGLACVCVLNVTMHSTHFIDSYIYGIKHMVKYHSVREETHCRLYSFQLAVKVLYMHYPTYRIAHTTAFVRPVVEHWLEQEIAQWVPQWINETTYRTMSKCCTLELLMYVGRKHVRIYI